VLTLATWNLNSVRARKDRLLALLGRHGLDVLCLQELKVEDAGFPAKEVEALGWHVTLHGQKTYNGVAILSKEPVSDVSRGFGDGGDDAQSRFLVATVRGVRVASAYFPNGGEVGSDKYQFKLAWMKRMRAWLDAHVKLDAKFALCGDFNVAAFDDDIQNPEKWRDTVLANDECRAALEHVRAFGLVDVFRKHVPAGRVYSWWDYQQLGFPKNDGLRIDHVYATPPLAALSSGAEVDRNERKGKQPSDHAPVIVRFDV
jgi:exodeoxyribonuclease III